MKLYLLFLCFVLLSCSEVQFRAEYFVGTELPDHEKVVKYIHHDSLGGDSEAIICLAYTECKYKIVEQLLLKKGVYRPLSEIEPYMIEDEEEQYIKDCEGFFFYSRENPAKEHDWGYLLIILNKSKNEIYIHNVSM